MMTSKPAQARHTDQAAASLRSRAEALLEQISQAAPGSLTGGGDALHLLHELQVHHVELQLQNEELEQARAEAVAARDSYARLFDLAPAAMFSLAPDARILHANHAAAALLRQTRETLCQRTLNEFLAPVSKPALQTMLEQAKTPEPEPTILQLVCSEAAPCRLVQAQVAFDPATQSVLLTLLDVTARERTDQLQRAAVLALERAVRLKNEFLSRMSHELRTPLNAVLGFSQLQLADTSAPLSAVNRQRVEHVQRAGQHLLSIIEHALDVASIESGPVAGSLEPVDVAVAVAECPPTTGQSTGQSTVGSLQIDTEPGSGAVVAAQGPQSATIQASPTRVLYIESNPGSRTVMGGVVAGIEGASLEVAQDGVTGLALARELRPAIVIVDLALPDIDGITVLRTLRQSPETRHCYSVALSADASGQAAADMRAAGADEFWPKPSGVDFMRQRLAELLCRN